MTLQIPELSLVVLIGASGSGKSTFARRHFKPTEIVSSDACRGVVSDDENNQAASGDAFELLHFIVRKRLKRGLLTVVDATNVQPESRKPLVQLAREFHCLPVAIVLDVPERLCQDRNETRPDRNFGRHVIAQHRSQLRRSLPDLKREGFRHVHVLRSPEEVEAVQGIEREPLYNNLRHRTGPFDIIGDVHGCYAELTQLLEKLGYGVRPAGEAPGETEVVPPPGRTAVFVGDLVDRGPDSPAVLKLVMGMVRAGTALCVPGNHDEKLLRKLWGKNVQLKHGLAETMEQLAGEPDAFLAQVRQFIDGLVSHYVLDGGRLVVAHAGLKEEMQGRGSGAVRSFCLYGETTGETDEFGLPVRYNWAADYRGKATVVYGHTPVPVPEWLNNTIDIDTGCVFGGDLTALRYPEKELVSVPAARVYYEPVRPLRKPDERADARSAQQQSDALLDIDEVLGKRIVSTRLANNVTVREENAAAALEVMSRFAVDPKWLIYLPPTMSPSETSKLPGYLEHPAEALAHYASVGVRTVVCQEKHMGSRTVVVVCRDADAARRRFGSARQTGVCYTRTGRPFFNDEALENAFLERVRAALTASGFWGKLNTDWVCLDAELMPWSAKAQALLHNQYAAVGAASRAALPAVLDALKAAQLRGLARGRAAGRVRLPARDGAAFHGSLPPVLLAGAFAGRLPPGALPHPGYRRGRARQQGPRVAPGHHPRGLRRRPGAAGGNALPRGRPGPRRRTGRRRAMVARPDRPGRRGHGGEAARLRHPRQQGTRAAGRQVPRPRVPAHHLRPRVRRPGQPGAAPAAGPGRQAVAGPARVCPGPGSPRTLRGRSAPAPRARMRLRRPRPRKANPWTPGCREFERLGVRESER
jgi:protein phosphatase